MFYVFISPLMQDLYRHLDLHSQVDDDVCERYNAAGIRREFVHLFDVLEPNFADSYQHDIVYVSQMKWTPKKAGVLRYCHKFVYLVLSNVLSNSFCSICCYVVACLCRSINKTDSMLYYIA